MRIPVRLPQFGESAAEATIMAWLVEPGTAVAAEQDLVEVQTEKSVLTVAAPTAGLLLEHCVQPGAEPAVGDVLAWLEAEEAPAGEPAPPAAPASSLPAAPAALARHPDEGGRPALNSRFLSPRVRLLMGEHGLQPADLAGIAGTGEQGRVTADDLAKYLSSGSQLSPQRQAIATGMRRSWARPLATAARLVRFDPLLAHRRTVAGRPSATVYALRALSLALREDDRFTCRLVGTRLIPCRSLDLAVAVEVGDAVLTPVIKAVDTLDLGALSSLVDTAVARARTRGLADGGDAVGAVTNYGTFGLTWATPIPQPGHATILGVGAVQTVPDWNPATHSWDRTRQAELTLTFDHRIADGGAAARLLLHVAELMEHPQRL